jgi:hypothetical protein
LSQIFKQVTAGVLPPVVPTSFTTQNGTAVPAANILIVNGNDSTENNANGIITKGGVVGTGTANELDVVITNRLQGTVTTSDATPTAMITFTPTVTGSYTIETRISAYNSTDTLGAGYSLFGTARFNSGTGTSTLCGTADRIVNEETGMENASATFTVSGANILINAVGLAGKTINWSAVSLYTFVGA